MEQTLLPPPTGLELRKTLLIALVLVIGTMALYAPAVQNGFVNFDDPDYVTQNGRVLQGLNSANAKWAFGTDNPASNWHPLTWLSHMLDVTLYRGNSAGHHFTNILLQSLDVAALFLVLAFATSEMVRSAAVAVLFAVHPLNVEAVAWVAERKTVLCMLFFVLAIGAYCWYAKKQTFGRYLCVALLFALALLSKVMVLTFPFVLLLMDYWPLRRFNGSGKSFFKLILEKVPLFVMSAAGAGMTLYVHAKEHALAGGMPLSWRVRNGIYSYVVYLGKMVFPVRLAAFYPHPENSLGWGIVAAAALALAGVSYLVWKFRARKYLVTGWLWFLGTMFPMVGFIQSGRQGMADRYMYIPMIGLLLAAVWLLADLARERKWNPSAPLLAFVLCAASCAYLTEIQIGYWHDSYTLFGHALAVTSRNGMAENNFGNALLERGQLDAAKERFAAAVKYSPDLAAAHYNLAVSLQRENKVFETEQEYRTALSLSVDPLEQARAHNNLGALYSANGRYSDALEEFNAAIQLNALEQNSYLGRGNIEMMRFEYDKAANDFAQAAQIAPSPHAFFLLGRALEGAGDLRSAAGAYTGALKLAPGFAEARARLDALRTGQQSPK